MDREIFQSFTGEKVFSEFPVAVLTVFSIRFFQ
jgi:hypothetical protein